MLFDKIKSLIFGKPTTIKNFDELELEIELIAGDGGDGICKESLIQLVKQSHGEVFTHEEINNIIAKKLHNGTLLTDGETIIDPATIRNGATRIRSGWYLLCQNTIQVPPNRCPKCFNKLDTDGKCFNAIYDCWKC